MRSHENRTPAEDRSLGDSPQRPERMDAAESRWDSWSRGLYVDFVASLLRSSVN